MLQFVHPLTDGGRSPSAPDPEAERGSFDLGRIVAMLRRQYRLMLICMAGGLVLAGLFLLVAKPRYIASTQLLIEENKGRPLDDVQQVQVELSTSDTNILSQIELISSTRLALQVVEKLDLTHDAVFMAPTPSLAGKLIGPFRSAFQALFGSDEETSPDLARLAAEHLQRDLSVDRSGRTLALDLTYKSPDPVFAARVANAYAEAYINDGLEANFDATERTSLWLQARLRDLQDEARKADLAVQVYRGDHGLIAASGKLIAEQQLSEVNSQLVLAQADTARARARNDQFQLLLKSGTPEGILNAAVATGALDDSVIGKLRARYLDGSTRLAELVKRWGPDHVEAVKIRTEVEDVQRQLVAELERIAHSYSNDLAVAQSRETSLLNGLKQITGEADVDNQTQVELRALQQNADAYRDLYQSFLQRSQEALQQRSFPVQAARIISAAAVPVNPGFPRKPLILALGALFGLAVGAGVGGVRELRDRNFRTVADIPAELGLRCFGLIPHVPDQPAGTTTRPGLFPAVSAHYAIAHPFSAMAETLRRVKIAADTGLNGAEPRIIGVLSALPKEGKSTTSANLGSLLASQGARTLLIDADMRGLGLTRSLQKPVTQGLMEVLLDGVALADAVIVDPDTGLVFLPALQRDGLAHSADILGSSRMQAFLAEAGQSFDYIILDLPPMGPVADARSVARYLDAAVMVIRWGSTERAIVRSTLDSEPEIESKLLGVVLNNVDMQQLNLYATPGSQEYYQKAYTTYYTEA